MAAPPTCSANTTRNPKAKPGKTSRRSCTPSTTEAGRTATAGRRLPSDPVVDLPSPLDGHHVDGLTFLVHREDDSPTADARSAQTALIAEQAGKPRVLGRFADSAPDA